MIGASEAWVEFQNSRNHCELCGHRVDEHGYDPDSLTRFRCAVHECSCEPLRGEVMTYGLMTVERHALHKRTTGETLRVYLDGEDVTDRCVEADDKEGHVLLNCLDDVGHSPRIGTGKTHLEPRAKLSGRTVVCRHVLYGTVGIHPWSHDQRETQR